MTLSEQQKIHPVLLYVGLFLAVLVFVAALLLLLAYMPTPGADATGRRLTIISAHEKMIVSVLVHTTLLLVISVLTGAIIVLLVGIARRIERLSDRVETLAKGLESRRRDIAPQQSPGVEQ